jgi:hypothetical protein
MKKVMKNVFLGVAALLSIAVVTKIVGHPPKGIEQWILYAFPGGILMFFIFDPLLRAFSRGAEEKSGDKVDSAKQTNISGKAQPETPKGQSDSSSLPPSVSTVQLTEPDDQRRGISIILVALRWDSNPLPKQELRDRAAKAVQIVDQKFDKDVMDVKILVVDEKQQYVQLSVRANFQGKAEEDQMRDALKKEFFK